MRKTPQSRPRPLATRATEELLTRVEAMALLGCRSIGGVRELEKKGLLLVAATRTGPGGQQVKLFAREAVLRARDARLKLASPSAPAPAATARRGGSSSAAKDDEPPARPISEIDHDLDECERALRASRAASDARVAAIRAASAEHEASVWRQVEATRKLQGLRAREADGPPRQGTALDRLGALDEELLSHHRGDPA